jgi:DNA-binding transcriptional ArsR family regulator
VTDSAGSPEAEALSILREIIRRSGHEIRNSLNGVSVNIEVVRSRSEGAKGSAEVSSFAERASREVANASRLADATLALVDGVLKAAAAGSLRHGAASEIDVMIYGDGASSFMSSIGPLAEAIGVRVEERGRSVILRILPEDTSHSEN